MLSFLVNYIFKGVKVGDARIIKRRATDEGSITFFPEVFTMIGWRNVKGCKEDMSIFESSTKYKSVYGYLSEELAKADIHAFLTYKEHPVEIIPYTPPKLPKVLN